MSAPVLMQSLSRCNTLRISDEHFASEKDFYHRNPGLRSEKRPEYTKKTREAYRRQPDDGASRRSIRKGDRTAKDGHAYEESTDVDDISKSQQKIIDDFTKDPRKMKDPYSCLQENNCVLQVDDLEETNFLHQMTLTVKKRLMKRMDRNQAIQSWTDGIYKIIPWVLTRDPDLLDSIQDTPGILIYASDRFVQVTYCILSLLLDPKTLETLRHDCDGIFCHVDRSHPLVAFVDDINEGHPACPHKHANEILGYHDQLTKKLKDTENDHFTSCLYNVINNYCADPNLNAAERLVRLSNHEAIMRPIRKSSHDHRIFYIAAAKFERPKEQDREALYELMQIMKTIFEVCPQALYYKDEYQPTVYEMLLRYEKRQLEEGNDASVQITRDALNTLKVACIRDITQIHSTKIDYLYPGGEKGTSVKSMIIWFCIVWLTFAY